MPDDTLEIQEDDTDPGTFLSRGPSTLEAQPFYRGGMESLLGFQLF